MEFDGYMKNPLPFSLIIRHKAKSAAFILLAVFMAAIYPSLSEAEESKYKTSPLTNKGKKWRVGYYEGGPYINYPANLQSLARGLHELGWIDKVSFENRPESTDSKEVWEALSMAKNRYIQFVSDAYWSAGWNKDVRKENAENAVKRLRSGDIDFMIAMGTWAGQDLANDKHSVPIIVISVSDPVKSGIIRSVEDSGYEHVHARCDPMRYVNQIKLFHNMVNFRRLGIVYENTVEGRTYAALADVEKVAGERGFQIVRCEAPFSGVDEKEAVTELIRCHEYLASRVDAVYVTVHRGIDFGRMPEIMAPLLKYKIPTFSMRGPEEVERGVLLSISRDNFLSVGKFHAKVMARIFNGARPRELNQIFLDPKTITLNINTAEAIGYIIPPAFLKVTDKIFHGNNPDAKKRKE
jgi:ABC-type uncharacterized transport system substrate-binding protein